MEKINSRSVADLKKRFEEVKVQTEQLKTQIAELVLSCHNLAHQLSHGQLEGCELIQFRELSKLRKDLENWEEREKRRAGLDALTRMSEDIGGYEELAD